MVDGYPLLAELKPNPADDARARSARGIAATPRAGTDVAVRAADGRDPSPGAPAPADLSGPAGWAGPWLIAALLATLPLGASASEAADVQLAERVTVGTSDLVLNGAGLRKKLFFKVYVVGLYLPEKRQSPADVLAVAGPKRVVIIMLRTVPARRLADALEDAIRRNSSPEQYLAVAGGVGDLIGSIHSLVEGEKGDIVTFDWLPGEGTIVVFNGVRRGAAIPGADVYDAVLKAWLGERPVNTGIKEALLGQAN